MSTTEDHGPNGTDAPGGPAAAPAPEAPEASDTPGPAGTADEPGTAGTAGTDHAAGPAGTGDIDPEAAERLEKAVRAAEAALIEFEIAVESFRIEVENFSRLHDERLGPLYAHIEELEARIAETIAARTGDAEDVRRAREARARVQPLPGVAELFQDWLGSDGLAPDTAAMLTNRTATPPPRVRPGAEARTLFRELIRRCHPDLVTEPAEMDRRGAFVTRVNQAYALGDVATLRALTEEWEAGPSRGPSPMQRGEELVARLGWLAERRDLLAEIAASLEGGAIGSLLRLGEEDPDALLEEIAEGLREKIRTREAELYRAGTVIGPGGEPGAGTASDPGTGADPDTGTGSDTA
ncbi:hypothetical protein [Streptomyces sp. ST2-7A]|uniref:hypothetical protein n=1 Tax=Streptomyces sp. ST2-7A TaxID=2907214 RepID=UPI001F40E6A2|nr:hypothetical protein [Streptomyces sp. ST2-7A]MCE7080665.1 hypothetical protein [Streptomyces sp. ST2-7A]